MSKKILVISPIPSHPPTAGNKQRLYSLILNLNALGNEVHFVYVEKSPQNGDQEAMRHFWGDKFYPLPYNKFYSPPHRYFASLRKKIKVITAKLQFILRIRLPDYLNSLIYNHSIDYWYDSSIDKALSDLNKSIKPDIVIVEYVLFSKALECFDSDILKIIDIHDIFTDRYKIFLENRKVPTWYSLTQKQEDKGLDRANIIIAIQNSEADILKHRPINGKVVTVSHTVSPYEPLPKRSKRSISNILFFGSNNDINYDSFAYFIKDIFPLVISKFEKVQLILAGSICNRFNTFDRCLKLGTVDILNEVYDIADIVINPIRFGTGLKIKNIEALGYGKPLITTTIGAEGLGSGAGRAFLVADSPKDYVYCISQVLSNSKVYDDLSRNALDFAKEWNQNCLNELRKVLEGV